MTGNGFLLEGERLKAHSSIAVWLWPDPGETPVISEWCTLSTTAWRPSATSRPRPILPCMTPPPRRRLGADKHRRLALGRQVVLLGYAFGML